MGDTKELAQMHISYIKSAVNQLNQKIAEARQSGFEVKVKIQLPDDASGILVNAYKELEEVSVQGIEAKLNWPMKKLQS